MHLGEEEEKAKSQPIIQEDYILHKILIIWGNYRMLRVFGSFHRCGWEKKENKFVLLNRLFQLVLWIFHLIFLKAKWMVQGQTRTTNDGTRREGFGFLSVFQNRRTINAGIYHFGNKKHYTKHFDNHNNCSIGEKNLGLIFLWPTGYINFWNCILFHSIIIT